MSKEILQKYKALSEVVRNNLVEWDPIGVLGDGDWRDDEYDSYIPSICSILENSSEVSTLESKLKGAERRKTVAHGVSRGYEVANIRSPGGATE